MCTGLSEMCWCVWFDWNEKLNQWKMRKKRFLQLNLRLFSIHFWNSSQKVNNVTGEYLSIMISILKTDKIESDDWLSMYYCDFRRRIKLLAKSFQSFTTGLALLVLDNKSVAIKNERKYWTEISWAKLYHKWNAMPLYLRWKTTLTQQIIDTLFIQHDLQRLETYTRNQVECRLILDLTTDFRRKN